MRFHFLMMKNKFLLFSCLVILASCGRYSKVRDAANKEELQSNTRVYGEYGQPARQSKNTYANPEDAAERSAKIKDLMFGKTPVNNHESVKTSSEAAPASPETKTQAGS